MQVNCILLPYLPIWNLEHQILECKIKHFFFVFFYFCKSLLHIIVCQCLIHSSCSVSWFPIGRVHTRGAGGGAWTGIRNEECSTTTSVCPLYLLSVDTDLELMCQADAFSHHISRINVDSVVMWPHWYYLIKNKSLFVGACLYRFSPGTSPYRFICEYFIPCSLNFWPNIVIQM